jgi:hypothetical protein
MFQVTLSSLPRAVKVLAKADALNRCRHNSRAFPSVMAVLVTAIQSRAPRRAPEPWMTATSAAMTGEVPRLEQSRSGRHG